MKELKVKEWIIDKAQNTATTYNCFIDFTRRDENGMSVVEDGCVFVLAEEILEEAEKAIKVRLRTGDVVGSSKGWTLWIPKSQMMEIEEETEEVEEMEEEMNKEIAIMMQTGITENDAVKHMEGGSIVYTAADYIEECKKWIEEYDEDDAEHFRRVIADIEAAEKDTHLVYNDGDVVFYDGVKYYIMWVL